MIALSELILIQEVINNDITLKYIMPTKTKKLIFA